MTLNIDWDYLTGVGLSGRKVVFDDIQQPLVEFDEGVYLTFVLFVGFPQLLVLGLVLIYEIPEFLVFLLESLHW